MRSKREEINWEIEEDRIRFLRRFDPTVWYSESRLLDLRDIFRDEEIECLLSDYVRHKMQANRNPVTGGLVNRFIEFVARTGYKDEPKFNEDGEPLVRRTTPLHLVLRNHCPNSCSVVDDLFHIYNDFRVNYTDDLGYTHLHVAVEYRRYVFVVRFIERGQDPNVLWPGTSDSLLQAAIRNRDRDRDMMRALIRMLALIRTPPKTKKVGGCGSMTGTSRATHRFTCPWLLPCGRRIPTRVPSCCCEEEPIRTSPTMTGRRLCTLFVGDVYATTATRQRRSSRPTPSCSSSCRSMRETSGAGRRCNWPWRISCRAWSTYYWIVAPICPTSFFLTRVISPKDC
uniref:Uncharacterized protein n=1 Tax=Trichogramma kaykai TaxID=54128 RepID=A0ABD2XI18_9HYME